MSGAYRQLEDVEANRIPDNAPIKSVSTAIRLGFVRKVYGILAAQLLVTFICATPIATAPHTWIKDNAWVATLSLVVYMAVALGTICCRKSFRTFPLNYCMLGGLTISLSIMVGFISSSYTWQSVLLAAGLTSIVFFGLTAYAWFTKEDWTGFGPYLVAFTLALLVCAITICVLQFCGFKVQWLLMFYDMAGVLLFSLYMVYDTQLILGEYGGHKQQFGVDDYCFAALQLYLDLINMFLYILRLLGKRD